MKFFAIIAAFIAVAAAAPVMTHWSLHEIDAALQNPQTDQALIPYLEHALNQIMEALFAGHQVESIAIPLPADIAVIPVEPVPSPEIVPTPVVVEEVAAAPAQESSSPLVQIIVNVKQQEQVSDVIVPSPVPAPAIVPEIIPTPVIVVDQPFEPIDVTPVEVDFVPEPVIVQPIEINPIDVIAVGEIESNPEVASDGSGAGILV